MVQLPISLPAEAEWINALLMASGTVLLGCAGYVVDRANRCALPAKCMLAVLLALAGGFSILAAVRVEATWPFALVTALMAAVTVLAVVTSQGRERVGLNGWGMTRPGDQAKFGETLHGG